MSRIKLTDQKGNILIEIDNERIAFARHVDLNDSDINKIVAIYKYLSGDSAERLKNYLNFNEEQDSFCS